MRTKEQIAIIAVFKIPINYTNNKIVSNINNYIENICEIKSFFRCNTLPILITIGDTTAAGNNLRYVRCWFYWLLIAPDPNSFLFFNSIPNLSLY